MKVLENLANVLVDLLRADARRVLLGEDVADGTMLGLSRPAVDDPDLAGRLVSTPLCPTIAPAHAAGMAMTGLRPIVLLSSAAALVEGLSALREASLVSWRDQGRRSAPVLFVAPTGPGFGLGGDAGEAPEAMLTRIPGLRVVVGSDPDEAGALLRAAAEFWAGEEPTVLLFPRTVLLAQTDTPVQALARPFAAAHRVRDGRAATVFAWGESVAIARAAIERSNLDVALVNVECLSPLDRPRLIEDASATGKIVIAHAGPPGMGVGAELAAVFADEAILHLDAPITRVTGSAAPLRAREEASAVPSEAQMFDAVVRVATY